MDKQPLEQLYISTGQCFSTPERHHHEVDQRQIVELNTLAYQRSRIQPRQKLSGHYFSTGLRKWAESQHGYGADGMR